MSNRIVLVFLALILYSFPGFSQGIVVDDESYSAFSLAELLLENSCTEITSANLSSSESVAYFTANGGDFPLEEGVIIRSGKAKYSEGIYTGQNMTSHVTDASDPDLEAINNATGQTADITDVAFLEYEFVPLSDQFSFEFIFASNEYGQWQCVSADVFAFLLTNLDTGVTENIAVIPNTDVPVSVKNIRDTQYNTSCSSHNPQLFDIYNVSNAAASSINMRGQTVVMTASANITPNANYKIRMVIGDAGDTEYDSAVFIAGGSFETTVNLGDDQVICEGDQKEIFTDLPLDEYGHTWKKDGVVIPGESGNSLMVNGPGVYEIIINKIGTNCTFSDQIIFEDLYVEQPPNLSVCDTGDVLNVDLTRNDLEALGLEDDTYQIYYYASEEDAINNNPIPPNQVGSFEAEEGDEIFIRIYNPDSDFFCSGIYSFFITVDDEIVLNSPEPIEFCYQAGGYSVNLNQVKNQIMQGGSSQNYQFLFFHSENEAHNGSNNILSPGSFHLPAGFDTKIIWVRVQHVNNPECYQVISFEIIEHPIPEISELEDVIVCEEYELPEIEHGNYFTESNGEGEALFAGDIIEDIGTYYIFNGPDENGCTNQSSFKVIVVKKFDVNGTYCGSFIVPDPPAGGFYTEPGGPYGEGTYIPVGTEYTSDVVIYYYAEVDDELCQDEPQTIVIAPLPDLDEFDDVVVCNSYILPELEIGEYYTQPSANGEQLEPGTIITENTLIYVHLDNGTCAVDQPFNVFIIPVIEDITACGSYIVPEVGGGDFYTEDQGQGEIIPAGTELTESQRLYFYSEGADVSDCGNLYFDLTIIPLPPVDELEDVYLCEGEFFTLPPLSDGVYFTQSGREGEQLSPGDQIFTTLEIYINNADDECMNETVFVVDVTPLPELPSFTDIYTCEPYVLPQPSNGDFYTESGGQGQLLTPGTVISEDQTLFIYKQSSEFPYCEDEIEFTVYVNYVDLGVFEDVLACDSYTLPPLQLGDYYTEPGGEGEIIPVGSVINESQTLYIYAEQGDRFVCFGEAEYEVTITESPHLPNFSPVEKCGSYTLPELDSIEIDHELFEVKYYEDAYGQNEITEDDYEFDQPGEYQVYVRAVSLENPDCIDQKIIQFKINPLNEIHIPNVAVCVDYDTGALEIPAYIDTEIDEDIYDVFWYFEDELVHVGRDFEAEEAGEYTVEILKIGENDGTFCDYEPKTFTVWKASQAVARAYVTTPDFAPIANIKVDIIKGYGQFLYALNDGPFQSDNVFYDVPTGLHVVTVTNLFGECGPIKLRVQVIKYPKFFTPNADGINDTWNITDLKKHNDAEIYIFSRFGQLLKTIKPEGEGWDGYFNGKPMPSDDYWFRVVYTMEGERLEYKANFTLKR